MSDQVRGEGGAGAASGELVEAVRSVIGCSPLKLGTAVQAAELIGRGDLEGASVVLGGRELVDAVEVELSAIRGGLRPLRLATVEAALIESTVWNTGGGCTALGTYVRGWELMVTEVEAAEWPADGVAGAELRGGFTVGLFSPLDRGVYIDAECERFDLIPGEVVRLWAELVRTGEVERVERNAELLSGTGELGAMRPAAYDPADPIDGEL